MRTLVLIFLVAALSSACASSIGWSPMAAEVTNWLPALSESAWEISPELERKFFSKDGRQVVEITLPAGVKPAWQGVAHRITGAQVANQTFTLQVEVRTEGLERGAGAYAVIDCYDENEKRLTVFHSSISMESGAEDWTTLTASGGTPAETATIQVCLILHANGTAWFANPKMITSSSSKEWPDLGTAVRVLTLAERPVCSNFIGVGFHHMMGKNFYESDADFELCYRRWDDLNPSFVRINHDNLGDRVELDRIVRHVTRMQKTGTQVYLTTWTVPQLKEDKEYAAYGKRIVDDLEYLVREKGLSAIRWYCIANELSVQGKGWNALTMPQFRKFSEPIVAELKKRKLDIALLATDASGSWITVDWASKNIAELAGAYGGHHYISEYEPRSLDFSPWWEGRILEVIGGAKEQGKPFIIGEFGAKGDMSVKDGVIQDRCIYYETSEEPWVAIQAAEAVIGALRVGVDAIGYWTFADLPDFPYGPDYQNKWGMYRNSGSDRSIRSVYYGYGLLTRTFRAGLKIYPLENADQRLRAVAGQAADGKWVAALVNRNLRAVTIRLPFGKKRKWLVGRYHPEHIIPGPEGLLTAWKDASGEELQVAADEIVVIKEK